ncbi:hypothetical protein [Clostridium sp. Cult1]|nr:hypothetical protein [Clostridium sp. Cult1]
MKLAEDRIYIDYTATTGLYTWQRHHILLNKWLVEFKYKLQLKEGK